MDDRYSRQILFAPLGAAGQERLAAARVTIVGCGALGTAQADLLARAGVGRLHLVDRDCVEASNLQRQALFDEEDARLAAPKARAAQARLRKVNGAIQVEAAVADLTPANAEELLAGSDVVLDGTDNFETRYLLNDWALARGVPWVYGAAVASRGMTFTILPGETACLNCIFPDHGEERAAPHETCDTAGVLAWTVSLVAALQVSEAVKLLVGARASLRRGLWSADLWRNQFRELAAPAPDPECRACRRREFVHLEGEGRAAVTLCGRNAVQIHEHRRALELAALAERLRPHGEVRANDFALRFLPSPAAHASDALEMMIFPDGRALIKGTTDAGLARSLYARYIGA
ncbi:MAG TPA: ThiF family adenylyltransferase [Terriglobales bacterium]|nr:ThiF family adenylyltransferase [Terriglobales bacterium]